MRSVRSASSAAAPDPDRTARARIRDAAVDLFASDGVAATSVRAIAARAGVSAALVIHHFGSKEQLTVACDEHVAATIRTHKLAAAEQGAGLDALGALRQAEGYQRFLRYLARRLVERSPEVDALVDELVEDAVAYSQRGVETGLLKPSDDLRGRTVVLTMWSLGALVLHEHLARLLGADITAGAPDQMAAYALPAMEILARGVMAEDLYERVRDAFAHEQERA